MPLKILLINEIENLYIKTLKHAHLPLWAGVLKGITPEIHTIYFIDCAFDKINFEHLKNYDLICLSILTPSAYNVYKIGDFCLKNNIKCIIGGVHASIFPEEVKVHCDSVVAGEVEGVWLDILEDVKNNRLKPFYNGKESELNELPYLDHKIYRKYRYTFDSLEIMRGCPYNCEFCTISYISGGKCRFKSLEIIKRELEEIKLKNTILIAPNIVVNRKRSIEIFDSVGPYNLRWGLYGSGNLLINRTDLLDSLQKNGCYIINIGFENLSVSALKSMHKHHNIDVDPKKLIAQLHDRGILVAGSLMVGWDSDNKSIFKSTIDTVNELELDFPYIFLFTPYPSTRVYYRLLKENRILTKDWSRYNGTDVVFQPKNMSREELLNGCIETLEYTARISNEFKYAFRVKRSIKRKAESLVASYFHRKFIKSVIKNAEHGLLNEIQQIDSN
ncbi:MAG: radical SAM protein [Thermoplasmata archaeon]|nr:MAG: radical SAM protein [Thermoplasmata archaeon]